MSCATKIKMFQLDLCSCTLLYMNKNLKQLWGQTLHTQTSAHLFVLSSFLPCYQSQKFPYDSAVLHDSLHVDCLTVCKHLVTHATDWTIPEREMRGSVIKHDGHINVLGYLALLSHKINVSTAVYKPDISRLTMHPSKLVHKFCFNTTSQNCCSDC